MSFVDLMGDEEWADADIDARVNRLIRSAVSESDELKAARLSRKKSRSEAEEAFVSRVDAHVEACVSAGEQARADASLLAAARKHEAASARLARPRLAAGVPARPARYRPASEEEATHGRRADGELIAKGDVGQDDVTEWLVFDEGTAGVEPLPAKIKVVDEDGRQKVVANPAVVVDEEEIAVAKKVIATAKPEVADLVERRKKWRLSR